MHIYALLSGRRRWLTVLVLLLALGVARAQTTAPSGSVGIGTTQPTQTLDVNGGLRVRGLQGTGGLPMVQPDGTLGLLNTSNTSDPYAAQPQLLNPNPASGTVGGTPTGTYPASVVISGSVAYVVNSLAHSLQLFDVSTPASPRLLSTATTDDGPRDVAVTGNLAYVVCSSPSLLSSSKSLQVFDVSVPTSPKLLSTTGTATIPRGVAVSGSMVYVVGSTLQVFDASAPASPKLLSTTSIVGNSYSIAASGTTAYIVAYDVNSLQIFDLGVPASPKLLSTTKIGNNPGNVVVSGTTAYVINADDNSLQIFDVSLPASPKLLSTTDTGNKPFGIAVSGTSAYVINYDANTLQVFDVSAPAGPKLPSTTATGKQPLSVAVSGTNACVVTSDNTLQVFQVGSARTLVVQPDGSLGLANSTNLAATTIAASGSIATPKVTSPATGAANMLAASYGNVYGVGALYNASGNVTVAHTAGSGEYTLTFTGPLAAADFGSTAVSLTLFNGPGFVSFSNSGTGITGKLVVRTYSTAGVLTDRGFAFVVFQP